MSGLGGGRFHFSFSALGEEPGGGHNTHPRLSNPFQGSADIYIYIYIYIGSFHAQRTLGKSLQFSRNPYEPLRRITGKRNPNEIVFACKRPKLM